MFCVIGLIAAACGHLETVLQNNGYPSKTISSNGHSNVKIHQNGSTFKSSKGLLNGVYSNGNGVRW